MFQHSTNLREVGTRIVGYCCDRLDQVLRRIVGNLWNAGLEKLLSDDETSNGCLACEVSEGSKDSSRPLV